MNAATGCTVALVEALPTGTIHVSLRIPAGMRLGEVLSMPEVIAHWPDAQVRDVGIHSKPCGPERILRDGDRVEFYRGLVADAKAARRERAGR